ncbi:MAG TPA: membrane protein insertase YidC [Candidatus Polarisedimenticolia bacterium]|nr:membrane protein insertase YidC [Candidatus Polarisedimenticolia bacterium]
MDNKRYLIALALSMGVILLWTYFVIPPPKPPAAAAAQSAQQAGPTTAGSDPTNPPAAPATGPAAAGIDATPPAASEVEAQGEEAPAAIEKTVETDLYRMRVQNRGGHIVSWQLKHYFDDEGRPLELVNLASTKLHRFPLDLEFSDADANRRLQEALFVLDVSDAADETKLSLRYSDGKGLSAWKTLHLSSTSYLMRLEVGATLGGRRAEPLLVWGAGFGGETGLPPNSGDRNEITRLVYAEGSSVTRTAIATFKDNRLVEHAGPVRWAGIEEHYFTALLLPDGPVSGIQLRMDPLIEEGREKRFLSLAVGMTPNGAYQLFVGPKDRNLLASLRLGIETIVDYGHFGAIAEGLFFLLRHINGITGNWGWSIILLTVIIRLAFFPITHKSSVGMRRTQEKMKKIQPRIEAIKKKYKSMKKDMANRQKMNEEIMALYGKEGMNPLASMTGCLPLLLQLPILWGFYNLLVSTIELRHAPFGLWIMDLSKKDPYYITPIVMGITMMIQQVMTGTTIPDPAQRRIMMLMPLIFTWFFKDLPSGLVLYWLVNNMLGIGQQYLINAQVAREGLQTRAAGKA